MGSTDELMLGLALEANDKDLKPIHYTAEGYSPIKGQLQGTMLKKTVINQTYPILSKANLS